MITKIENALLLCVVSRDWEMKDTGKKGTSYKAIIYTEKSIVECKTDEILFSRMKDKELVKGTAVIEVSKTSYNEKERVVYQLVQFGEKA